MNEELKKILREIENKLSHIDRNKEREIPIFKILFYLQYKSVIDLHKANNKRDVATLIAQSDHPHKEEIGKIWMEHEDSVSYSFIPQCIRLLEDYDFSPYQSVENEWCIFSWIIGEFTSRDSRDGIIRKIVTYKKNIGNNIKTGSVLFDISTTTGNLYQVVNYIGRDLQCYASTQTKDDYDFTIGRYFLHCFDSVDIKYIDDISSFDEVQFDIIFTDKSLSSVFNHVKEGGFCVAFEQPSQFDMLSKEDQELILRYKILSFIEIFYRNYTFFCVKENDDKGIITLCDFFSFEHLELGKYTELLNKTFNKRNRFENIKELHTNELREYDSIQLILKKDLKLISTGYDALGHDIDEYDFVWRRIEDVLHLKDDIEEKLYNTGISGYKIFNIKHMSGRFCLYDMDIPSKFYLEKINNTLEGSVTSGKGYRLITEPSLVCAVGGIRHKFRLGLYRIYATLKTPVCIGEGIGIVEVDSNYDERFINYQLRKNIVHERLLLVAPTKEEQVTFYWKKLFEEYPNGYKKENFMGHTPSSVTGIGFENFRCFQNLNPLRLKEVNILVGGNNAGKSTFIKGLLLMFDNLKMLKNLDETEKYHPIFRLNMDTFHEVRVGTFNRIFCKDATPMKEGGERCVTFKISLSQIEVATTLSLKGEEKEGEIAKVPIASIKVTDPKRGIEINLNFKKSKAEITYSSPKGETFLTTLNFNKEFNSVSNHLIPILIFGVAKQILFSKGEDDGNIPEEIRDRGGYLCDIAEELDFAFNSIRVEYIQAHGVMQKILFDNSNRNDYMALTLHEFMEEKIGEEREERKLVCSWLERLGIGKDFEVSHIGGEAYTIKITNLEGHPIYLADMGMGANQLVILLIRLAIVLHRQNLSDFSHPYRTTVIVEEPEQNMHPDFQSKLADLFYEISRDYGINFMVETHSEYMVRKTQVFVKELEAKDEEDLEKRNPFAVYYFPSPKDANSKEDPIKEPRLMQYRMDGNFYNEFGRGFYDESTNLLFLIL